MSLFVVVNCLMIKQVICIVQSQSAVYLVFFDTILLFQAPKFLLNVEVTEATILKPTDANGM
jgi:hypothetical protein